VIPCGCSQKTGTVRRALRDMLGGLEKEYPRMKESLLSAMGNIEPSRLLDPRYLNLEDEIPDPEAFPILTSD
jgi:tRNA 2-thiocytidine biosynthesis protein TtcA